MVFAGGSRTWLSSLAVLVSIGFAYSAGSAAQSPPANEVSGGPNSATDTLQEIVVTALRRETSLQTTPAAVAAVSGAEMRERGISDVQDIALAVPGVSFGEAAGMAHIAIRGIGSDTQVTGHDPRVAYYQDGVYIARPSAQLGGMFDLERVEVLKGPQGTLYGRNATGGALNVISRAPSQQMDGYALLSYGNYNDVNFDAAIGGGVTETLAVRTAVHVENRDGFGKNLTTGQDIDNKEEWGARTSLLWSPSSSLSFLTIADYSREHDNANGVHLIGLSPAQLPLTGVALGGVAVADSLDIASDTTPRTDNRIWGLNETMTFSPDWGTIKSVSAYRHTKTAFVSDVDGTSTPLVYINPSEDAEQYSEELQIDGKVGRVDWLAGAMYFNERANDATVAPFSFALVGGPLTYAQGYFTGGKVGTDAYATYLRLAYHLSDAFTVTAGGRYNWEKKSIADTFQFDFSRPYSPSNSLIPIPPFPRSANASFSSFDPSFTLEYKLSDNVFVYASYTQGFKSGGFVMGVAQPPFKQEDIKSYEMGVKTTSLSGHLTANLTGFRYDYTNLQVSEIVNTAILVVNAASATVNGVEFESRLGPYRGFSVNGAVAYLDARYDKFFDTDPAFPALGSQDLSGKQLTQAPKVSAGAGVQQVWQLGAGQLKARTDVTYVSRNYFSPFNQDALSQAGYALGSASVRYQGAKGWSIEGYVRNISDKRAVAQSYLSNALVGAPVLGTLIPPRMYGIRLGYEL